jgi:aspartate/methionine/tyrosine aminotransferase
MFSDRVNRIAMSPTLRIGAKAGQMRAQGIDVVDFSVGEPDFPTPEPIKRAAKAALDANFTKYTANDGIPDLKKAICEKLLRENGLKYSPDEIIVSPGAKVCLFHLAMALCGPGDDVLIPSPYWVSYPDQVTLAGANPVFLPTREEDGFRLQAKTLAASITPNTKALILNYPCNPTGATYSREDLEAIADVCVREDIWVVSDEIYERLTYDGARFHSIASIDEKIRKRSVVVNGFSKAYSMTGWRLGYAAGPRELIQACSKIQSHNTSNATSFVQKAGIEALRSCSMEVDRMKQEFERRRNAIVYRLRSIPGVSCMEPKGAFYAFPNVARYLDREFGGAAMRNTYGLAYYLLKEAQVAVVPGQAFGSDEHVRFSFALSMDRIEEGMKRVERALSRLEEPKRLRPRALNNVITKVRSAVPAQALAVVGARNSVLAEAEAHLSPDGYFEWNASIAGIVVQLRSNSPHLADFYQENFYPAALEGDHEPHAVVYAVKDIPGREPQAMVSLETGTGFVLNTAYYGQLRSVALALAADGAARTSGALLTHAAALDRDGRGVLVWGEPGSGRTAVLAAALAEEGVRLVGSEDVFVRPSPDGPMVDLPERKLYLEAKWMKHLPEIEKFLDRTKLENLAVSRDQCHEDHPEGECPLDRGAAVCVVASGKGRILLDPAWLGGGRRHVRRTALKACVLVAKDAVLPAVQELSPRDAARRLAEGNLPGGRGASAPFLNPHLAGTDTARSEAMQVQYERLFGVSRCVVVNASVGSPATVAKRLLELLR